MWICFSFRVVCVYLTFSFSENTWSLQALLFIGSPPRKSLPSLSFNDLNILYRSFGTLREYKQVSSMILFLIWGSNSDIYVKNTPCLVVITGTLAN